MSKTAGFRGTGSTQKLLIDEGVINLSAVREQTISREDLFSVLRMNKVHHLGEVARASLSQGYVNVYRRAKPKSGLPVMSPNSVFYPAEYTVKQRVPKEGLYANVRCGFVKRFSKVFSSCPNCGDDRWVLAQK